MNYRGCIKKTFECKCWKLFTVRLLKHTEAPVLTEVHEALRAADPNQIRQLSKRPDHRRLYWLCVLATARNQPPHAVAELVSLAQSETGIDPSAQAQVLSRQYAA